MWSYSTVKAKWRFLRGLLFILSLFTHARRTMHTAEPFCLFLSPWWSLAVEWDASNKALGLSSIACNMHHMHTYLGPFKRPCSLPGGLWRMSLFLSFPFKFHMCFTPRRVVHRERRSMNDAAYFYWQCMKSMMTMWLSQKKSMATWLYQALHSPWRLLFVS